MATTKKTNQEGAEVETVSVEAYNSLQEQVRKMQQMIEETADVNRLARFRGKTENIERGTEGRVALYDDKPIVRWTVAEDVVIPEKDITKQSVNIVTLDADGKENTVKISLVEFVRLPHAKVGIEEIGKVRLTDDEAKQFCFDRGASVRKFKVTYGPQTFEIPVVYLNS